jgi:hypothetical protein
MSWYGTHPTMTKQQAKAALPPGACRLCVYAVRAGRGDRGPCLRCGVDAFRRRVATAKELRIVKR